MVPPTMNAVVYTAPSRFEVQELPVPQIHENEVLLKVLCCGICGTDNHLDEGVWVAQFPLIPGHEIVGVVARVGETVKNISVGDRCVVDPLQFDGTCSYCRQGQSQLCENCTGHGIALPGGFAEYVVINARKVYKICKLTDQEATLVEPTSCAIHGMDKLNAPVGVEALVIGAGASALILSQLLRLNGALKVVIAANEGIKIKKAKELNIADEYVELDRENPHAQWEKLKQDYPHGFDVVVEATGSECVVNQCIDYVGKGGTLLIYSFHSYDTVVRWSPMKIFLNEIRVIAAMGQSHCFPRAIAYLESGKISVKDFVTDMFTIDEYQKALDKMRSRGALKIAITPR